MKMKSIPDKIYLIEFFCFNLTIFELIHPPPKALNNPPKKLKVSKYIMDTIIIPTDSKSKIYLMNIK